MLASGARLPREPVCGQGSGGGPSVAEPLGWKIGLPGTLVRKPWSPTCLLEEELSVKGFPGPAAQWLRG